MALTKRPALAGQVTQAELTGPAEQAAAARGVRLLAVLALTPALRLAVIRHAVPSGVASRAGCAACGAAIGLGRPWPVLGPIARCGRCRARVGPLPGGVELVVVAALGALALLVSGAGAGGGAIGGGSLIVLVAIGWWLGWAIALVFVDAAVHRLPDRKSVV